MRTKFPVSEVPRETIGNIGLYYICYRLSLYGWNVLPTSRNAKGIDIFIYSQDASYNESIQVKTLSKRNTVPLGKSLNNLISEYFLICVRNYPQEPICYVMKTSEVKDFAHKTENNGKISYWLQRAAYEDDKYKEKWERIGHGIPLGKKLNK
ncbi:MAG: hypothetical protein K8S16_15290 [Bacteroidales bacterium]|nr:hypothetical protein [Bacteroidales bacterium]